MRSFGRTSCERPGRVRKAIRFSCLAFSEARRYERASIELEKISLINLGFGPAISSDTPMAITLWFTG